MMARIDTKSLLRKIWTDARPLVEEQLDLAEQVAGFRDLAANNGLDWSAIKALLKADIQDARSENGSRKLEKVIDKADLAIAYADMLGLTPSNMNEKNFSAEEVDPETGEIIEPDAQHEATVETTSPMPEALPSPASSEEPCSHGSGAVQDRCESTAPPIPLDAGDIPEFLRRVA